MPSAHVSHPPTHDDGDRAPARVVVAPTAPARTGPSLLPTASTVASLQRTAGNTAVQRLVTSKELLKQSEAGRSTRKGKTFQQIGALLDEYHELRRRKQDTMRGKGGIDRALQILHEIVEDTDYWLRSHALEKEKTRHRFIAQLNQDALTELGTLKAHRATLPQAKGDENFVPAENAFLLKMEGSASSALERVGKVISKAVPRPGDSVEADVAVKVPVDPSGAGYIGFRFHADAARTDRTSTYVRFEAAVTGGVRFPGVGDLGAELGKFIQAHGKTPEEAMKLVSYGLYQDWRRSLVPREVVNFMWGGAASSVGWTRAEQWAANVENEVFGRDDAVPLSSGVGSSATTNAYVRTGYLVGGAGEIGVNNMAKLSAGVNLNVGAHYDRESVEQGKLGGKSGKQGGLYLPSKMPSRGKSGPDVGTDFMTIDGSFGFEVGPWSGELAAALEIMNRKAAKSTKFAGGREGYFSVHLSASAPLPFDQTLVKYIVDALKEVPDQAKRAATGIGSKAGKHKQSVAGIDLADMLGSAAMPPFSKIAENDVTKKLEFGYATEKPSYGFKASEEYEVTKAAEQPGASLEMNKVSDISIGVNLGYQFGEGRKEGLTIDVQVSTSSGIEADVSLVSMAVKRSRRLLRIVWTGGSWTWD